MLDYDVVIAGAGPGGMAVARRLVATNPALRRRILVVDRSHFPRPKPCGGGLTGQAMDAMEELGFELAVPHWPSVAALVRYWNIEREVELGRPVNIVRREQYDASLVDQVRGDGVEVAEGEAVVDYVAGASRVRVRTSRREVDARVLVGADGASSIVRKRLNDGRRRVPHRLFKLELSLPATRPWDPRMLYDFSLMRCGLRGYLWIFPVPGDYINVGLMHYPGAPRLSGGQLTELLRRGLAGHGVELPRRGTRGWPAWGYSADGFVAGPRVLSVGDAAGIDALTGEGIGVALEHGVIAGDAIARAMAAADYSFAGYGRALRRATVGRELALDTALADLLYGTRFWREWLSLVLFDDKVIELYADRVAGTSVLANQKPTLFWALARHATRLPWRMRAMHEAEPGAGTTAAVPT